MLNYTERECQAVQQVLNERYKSPIEIHLADCEVQPDKELDERVECPAIFWSDLNCNFVLIEMADDEFKGFFFYQPDEHFASTQQPYSDAANCVIAILQSQADQFGESQGYVSGATAAEID